jgi:2-polyprenyl-6-methoxyphenol hydroxylase-like FAD-dependent oxidoreductase
MQEKKIIIVGGGTSGWMAAAALSHSEAFKHWHITLVESENIGTIGVGEGSTPYLQRFMKQLGFAEKEWMQHCDATYKTGIEFSQWNGDNTHFFHPFYTAMDVETAEIFFNAANGRRRGQSEHINGDNFFMSGHLAKHSLTPVPVKKMPAASEYGYHFDAAHLAKLLKDFSDKNGVEHIVADVTEVQQNELGDVTTLTLNKGKKETVNQSQETNLHADFFIDASGFKALLIDKSLKVPFISFSDELFNDAAIAVSTPPLSQDKRNYTQSTALSSGWMWRIPLQSRTGNGYVYSSRHLSQQQAEVELAEQLNIDIADNQFRHLKMQVGMRATPWQNNVLAIGLAHAFIEPLEATALMMTQCTIERFIQLMSHDHDVTVDKKEKLNTGLSRLILGVKDYIVAHYVTSKRQDSNYWQEISTVNSSSINLNSLLDSWKSGKDFDASLYNIEQEMAYFRPSWYVLLAGMDYRNEELSIPHDGVTQALIEQAQQHSLQQAQRYFSLL